MRKRPDGRKADELRPMEFTCDFQTSPLASVLARFGKTRVICAVSAIPGVPRWMREQGVPGGWLTSEYDMLPGSTPQRSSREARRGSVSGRSSEIQRLIGRSLRAAVDLTKIGEQTLYVDCDVLDADGGTRCASICGASVAVETALRRLMVAGVVTEWPMRQRVAAISVGVVAGTPLLDLCYEEDSGADVDMNVVMMDDGRFVEVQGTAETEPFSQDDMDKMLALARKGSDEIFAAQCAALDQA